MARTWFPRCAPAHVLVIVLGFGLAGAAASSVGTAAGPPPSVTTHPVLMELARGLGVVPSSRMGMKFDVTFMKIDVADLEARLAPEDAARLGPLLGGGESSGNLRGSIAGVLLRSRPILLTMTYLRDSDYGRFRKGIRSGMEAARRSGAIDAANESLLIARMETDMAPIETRAVFEGDVLAYRIDGDSVRTVYVGANGDVVLDVTREDPVLAQALPASWFAEESRFRNGLIDSLLR